MYLFVLFQTIFLVVIIFWLLNILKIYKILKAFTKEDTKISFAIWENNKLIFYTPNFASYTKRLNIKISDLKVVSPEKILSFIKNNPLKHSLVNLALKKLADNFHKNTFSFEMEIPIGHEFFFLKFHKISRKNNKYSILTFINLSENIKKYSESFVSSLINIPDEFFNAVLDRRPTIELIKKLFDSLKSSDLIDSLVVGLKNRNGTTKILYANVSGEELINHIIPRNQKSLTTYFIDFGTKQYFENSFKINLPEGYQLIQIGKKVPTSIYGVPLTFENKIFGAILFEKSGVDQFNLTDFYLFDTFAYLLSINMKFKETIEKLHLEKEANYKNSIIDPLTKAYNRNFLYHFLEKIIEQSKRVYQENSLVFLDLDDFKEINDKYGHHTGDEVLKSFVKIAKKTLRKMDVISRFGGDEFVIILPNTNLKNAENVIKRLENVSLKNKIPVKFSYGLITIDPNKTIDENLRLVDQKMYEIKKKKQEPIN